MKNIKQKGYAILFAMVVISIISIIVAGLSNSAYKQLVLSSVAKDSQSAFYQSDTATECALYADNKLTNVITTTPPPTWSCGLDSKDVPYDMNVVTDNNGVFTLTSRTPFVEPCFGITIDRSSGTSVSVSAKGYSSCDPNNGRRVEREIKINY